MGKNEKTFDKNQRNNKGDEKNKKVDVINKKSLKRRRSRARSHFEDKPVNVIEKKRPAENLIIDVAVNFEEKRLEHTCSTQNQEREIEPKKPKLDIESEKKTKSMEFYQILDLQKKFGEMSNLNYNPGKQFEIREMQTDVLHKGDSYKVYTERSEVIFGSEGDCTGDSAYETTWKPTMDDFMGYNGENVHKLRKPISRSFIYKYEEKFGNVDMPNKDEAIPSLKDETQKFKSGTGKWRCTIL